MITDEVAETLRQHLRGWYRKRHPWTREPTLEDFRKGCKLDHASREVLDELVKAKGEDFELRRLRLIHLIEVLGLQPCST